MVFIITFHPIQYTYSRHITTEILKTLDTNIDLDMLKRQAKSRQGVSFPTNGIPSAMPVNRRDVPLFPQNQ